MTPPRSISLKEAQKLIFSSQKLYEKNINPLDTIEHLGYVQIDTISVIERAHHHVFWTRNPNYKTSALDQLVKSRKVFEHWSHAASFLPMKDYRYTLPIKKSFKESKTSYFPRDPKVMKQVLSRIEKEGPLRSKDFKHFKNTHKTKENKGWGDWKPAKKALERLFLEGILEISARDGFNKVYDLSERVIPKSVSKKTPTKKEYHQFLINRTLRHHGLATAAEIGYLRDKKTKGEIQNELQILSSLKKIELVKIKGVEKAYYCLPGVIDTLPRSDSKIRIFSPFDNLIIQREKLKTFFNFEYQIECYVPEAKRKFGYFCLPIFKGTTPIARIDCKADRKERTLLVQSLHCEKGFSKKDVKVDLEKPLVNFAKFNGCDKIY